jgi:hypothetical protein
MLIRDLERPFAPRRGKEVSPLRKTAEGLGLFLDQLSEEVRENAQTDSADGVFRVQGKDPSRGFKLAIPNPGAEPVPAINVDLSEEEIEALGLLKEARNLASDASNVVASNYERGISQERLKVIFTDLSARRIEILASMLDGKHESDGDPLFSLATPESARAAYAGIDDMIMKLLASGVKAGADGTGGADSTYNDHGAALSAAEQLREFLTNEGPAKAFSRFREINRSNILGLLQ